MAGPFQLIQNAADDNGVNYSTVINRIKNHDLRVFKLPGKRGHYVDVAEAREVLGKRQKYGSFGPDVQVIDFSNVVDTTFDVID